MGLRIVYVFLSRPAFCHVLRIVNAIVMEVKHWEDGRRQQTRELI